MVAGADGDDTAATVVEVPVFEVPDWAGDEPGHIHPGARLLRDPYKQGLYCSYCSTLDPSHVIPFCDVAPQRVDLRLLTIASAYSDHMMNGVDQAAAQSLRKSSATFAKRVADLRPDTRWRGESLTSRSGPETATGLAEDPLLSSPHPFGRSAPDREPEAEIFRAMLACTTAGGDELDLLRDIAASADELRSRAALRLLSMHMPRMPAWFWNPSLPMPEHLIAEADAIHDGARSTPVVLWDLERARKNLDVVLASVADPRWMVAVQAVGALPDPRRSRSLWSSLDADVRSRLVDLLFDWWDRALGEPTPPHQHALSRSLGLLAASMSDTPSPRYLALKQSLAAKSRTQPLQTMAYAEAQSISS